MISKEEVKHIAKLARLGLSDEEIKKFQKELSSILDYVEKLEGVDVSKIEPPSHTFRKENITRKDEASKFNSIPNLCGFGNAKKLIDGHLKVKPVLQ